MFINVLIPNFKAIKNYCNEDKNANQLKKYNNEKKKDQTMFSFNFIID
jgi:hypothetical protein